MVKAKRLKQGDKVAIVSLSSGTLGEGFAAHELKLGIQRLKELGLEPVFMPNSLKGIDFIHQHPEARAQDLKDAFAQKDIKAVVTAIGGNDTYKTLPYLMSDENFIQNVKKHPKIFMGFSDTTVNHLMFYKLGLCTFYGPAFLTDFAELATDMLPYTKNEIGYLFNPEVPYQLKPSAVWYEDRTDFSPATLGSQRVCHKNRGYEFLKGKEVVSGQLLGGCIELLSLLAFTDDEEKEKTLKKFDVFPTLEEWQGKVMFFETSEEKMPPQEFAKTVERFKSRGIFDKISGLLVGKPIDEKYYDEYKDILISALKDYDFPIVYNMNFGHAYPRMVLPYGATVEIDPKGKRVTLLNSTLM